MPTLSKRPCPQVHVCQNDQEVRVHGKLADEQKVWDVTHLYNADQVFVCAKEYYPISLARNNEIMLRQKITSINHTKHT